MTFEVEPHEITTEALWARAIDAFGKAWATQKEYDEDHDTGEPGSKRRAGLEAAMPYMAELATRPLVDPDDL